MARGSSSKTTNLKEFKSYLNNRAWKDHSYALFGLFGLIVSIFSYYLFYSSGSTPIVHYIQPNDAQQMHQVFRSGDPWMILCLRSNENMPKVFEVASQKLDSPFSSGVMDCHQQLPSGKTVLSRFGIQSHLQPTVFVVANGDKPRQIFMNDLKKSKNLVAKAKQLAEKGMHEIQSSEKLNSKCFQRSYCVLLLRSRKLSVQEKELMNQIMMRNRKVAFAWLDSVRYELSIESLFPPFVQGSHRMVMFRRNSTSLVDKKKKEYFVDAVSHRGDFDFEDLTDFIEKTPQEKFKALRRLPTFHKRKVVQDHHHQQVPLEDDIHIPRKHFPKQKPTKTNPSHDQEKNENPFPELVVDPVETSSFDKDEKDNENKGEIIDLDDD